MMHVSFRSTWDISLNHWNFDLLMFMALLFSSLSEYTFRFLAEGFTNNKQLWKIVLI